MLRHNLPLNCIASTFTQMPPEGHVQHSVLVQGFNTLNESRSISRIAYISFGAGLVQQG